MHGLSTVMRCTAVVTVASLLMLLTMNNAATAKIGSTRISSHNLTTTRWGNAFTHVGLASTNTPFVYGWSQNTGAQYTYVDIVNVGTLSTTGNTVSVSTQDAKSSRQDAPDLLFSSCSGSWNQTTNACSGSITSLGNTTHGTVRTNLTLAVGQRITVRIRAQKTKKALWTSTLSISVNRSQVRTATIAHS